MPRIAGLTQAALSGRALDARLVAQDIEPVVTRLEAIAAGQP